MLYDIDRKIRKRFSGEYRKLLAQLLGETWLAIVYVLFVIIVVWLLSQWDNLAVVFALTSIPILIVCSYVTSPDPNIRSRLPVFWFFGALLAFFIFLRLNGEFYPSIFDLEPLQEDAASPAPFYYMEIYTLENIIGIICWLIAAYLIGISIAWSLNVKMKVAIVDSEFIGFLLATWGAIFQLALFLSWILLPLIHIENIEGTVLLSFLNTVGVVGGSSPLKLLPTGIFLIGILIYVSLEFKDDPYDPISVDEVLPIASSSIIGSLLMAIRIPVWILLIILGFIAHFIKLFLRSVAKFLDYLIARAVFLLVGAIAAPLLLFLGNYLLLYILDMLLGGQVQGMAFQQVLTFFLINALLLVALYAFVVAIPLLAIRYRGESLKSFWTGLSEDIFKHGRPPFNAVGGSFSLFGILILAVPVASLLPGGPPFGVFSIIYTIVVGVILIVQSFRGGRKRDPSPSDPEVSRAPESAPEVRWWDPESDPEVSTAPRSDAPEQRKG